VYVRRLIFAGILTLAAALPAQAQVRLDIGIHLPGPPALVVIPGVPVYYAPRAPANVFFYGHQYWVFHADAWYAGPTWDGPWAVVAPVHLPAPILQVPVRYYKVAPGHWKTWRHDARPRWEAHYGRDWREDDRERRWHDREKQWDRGKHRDDDGHKGRGKGRGHGKRDD
jgi:hypothetical protein